MMLHITLAYWGGGTWWHSGKGALLEVTPTSLGVGGTPALFKTKNTQIGYSIFPSLSQIV